MSSTLSSTDVPIWFKAITGLIMFGAIFGVLVGIDFAIQASRGVTSEQLAQLGGIAYLREFLKNGDAENIEAVKAIAPKGWEGALNGAAPVATSLGMVITTAIVTVLSSWIIG
ncbi:hypothetical protein BDV96DRAFT_684002 [Lophiotrema nucula]|uniref:Uncharacterized protein n=1 Tax=Lophiotrema nucula TaxID=690887 RepID=A0A6A5ZK58_9PLEO|nr:hypothetical protein BDV96DRAFT_684002 [Lophiotrema nucula]